MPARKGSARNDIQRDAEAAGLRAKGLSYREIAAKQRCGVGVAYQRVQRAIAAVPVENVAQLRQVECDRLDAIIAKLWEVVYADHPFFSNGKRFNDVQDAGPVISALGGILKASESKRKLLGLDAPSRQQIHVITEDVVDAELRRLEQEHRALTSGDASVAGESYDA